MKRPSLLCLIKLVNNFDDLRQEKSCVDMVHNNIIVDLMLIRTQQTLYLI